MFPQVYEEFTILEEALESQVFDDYPLINVFRHARGKPYMCIEISLAGFDKDEIEVDLEDRKLVVKAEKPKRDVYDATARYFVQKLRKQDICWSLILPRNAIIPKTYSYVNGVLTIKIELKNNCKTLILE